MLSARMGKRTWVARKARWQGNAYSWNQVLLRTPGSEDLALIKATIWKVPMDSIFSNNTRNLSSNPTKANPSNQETQPKQICTKSREASKRASQASQPNKPSKQPTKRFKFRWIQAGMPTKSSGVALRCRVFLEFARRAAKSKVRACASSWNGSRSCDAERAPFSAPGLGSL